MKSSNEQLKKRGYFEDSDLEKYKNLNEKDLLDLTKSEIPQKRAIAIHILALNNSSNKYTPYFLDLLTGEKKLYVKLEITKTLEKGDFKTAQLMIPYLNKIPNNQFRKLPKKVSKKKTYLIPRDIIGRSLSKMDIIIFPLVLELLSSLDSEILSESLDVFAFMIYHNQKLASFKNFKILIELFNKYKDNDLILWKITMTLSAFRTNDSIVFLNKIKNYSNNLIIKLEVERSIYLIRKNS